MTTRCLLPSGRCPTWRARLERTQICVRRLATREFAGSVTNWAERSVAYAWKVFKIMSPCIIPPGSLHVVPGMRCEVWVAED